MTGFEEPPAIVTGSGSGIGQATAIELAKAGADVAVHYRSDREGAETPASRSNDTAAAPWWCEPT